MLVDRNSMANTTQYIGSLFWLKFVGKAEKGNRRPWKKKLPFWQHYLKIIPHFLDFNILSLYIYNMIDSEDREKGGCIEK